MFVLLSYLPSKQFNGAKGWDSDLGQNLSNYQTTAQAENLES